MIKSSLKYLLKSGWPFALSNILVKRPFIALSYHRIQAQGTCSVLADSLFGPDEMEFERQMAWLATHMRPVSERELLQHLEHKEPLPKRAVLVTFDDGYREQFSLAAPILKKYSVPAVFFISTLAVNERSVGWWDEIAWMVKHTKRRTLKLLGREYDLALPNRQSAIGELIARTKAFAPGEQRVLLRELERECDIGGVPAGIADRTLMTWEQVRAARDFGISIGSHTVSHRMLSRLSSEAQRMELVESKAELERQTGQEVLSLAYPFGGAGHFTTETMLLAKRAGYRLAFTLLPPLRRVLDPFAMSRLLAPAELGSFAFRLTFSPLSTFWAGAANTESCSNAE